MRVKLFIVVLACSLSTTVCGQTAQNKNQNSSNKNAERNMDFSKLTNPTVKSAIEAMQANELNTWYSYFSDNVVFTDDERTLDFKSFFNNAFEKQEKFLTIDKVENDGKNIYGNFYAGQWGTFNVFFKFTINEQGKISRLDIGQGK